MSQNIKNEIEYLAFTIAQLVKEHFYSKKFFSEIRKLKTSTEKAVYQHILFRGPSSYSNIRKALEIGHHGLSNSLKRMKNSGFLYITEEDQYEIVSRKENSERLREELTHMTRELERSERTLQIREYEEMLRPQMAHGKIPSSLKGDEYEELEAIESKLFSLYNEEFEDRWPQWIEEYKLTSTESKKIGSLIKSMMKSGEQSFKIEAFLSRFVDSRTAIGHERICSYYVKIYGDKAGKELAEKEICFFKNLRGQM